MKKSEIYRNAIEAIIAKYSMVLQDGISLEAVDFETSEERSDENIF